jgi:hypothetical protein
VSKAVIKHESKALITAINREHEKVEEAGRGMLAHALKCGHLLTEVKESLPHGQWTNWLDHNFVASERTAQLYMQLAHAATTEPSAITDLDSITAVRALIMRRRAPQQGEKLDPDSAGGKLFAAAGKALASTSGEIDGTATEIAPEGLPDRKWNTAVEHSDGLRRCMAEATQPGISSRAVAAALSEALVEARFVAVDLEQLAAAAARLIS